MPNTITYHMVHTVAVPRAKLWLFLSDTESFNRAMGLFSVKYTYQPNPGGGSTVIAESQAFPRLKWREAPSEWSAPEFLKFDRHFIGGPLIRLRVHVQLAEAPDPSKTIVTVDVTINPRNAVGSLLGNTFAKWKTEQGYRKAMDLALRWDKEGKAALKRERKTSTRSKTQVLRAHIATVTDKLNQGAVAESLARHLASQPDFDLAFMRPYKLADEWGLPRKDVLGTMLHAAKSGLLSLQWRILCPSCRGANEVFAKLVDVPRDGHCPSCNLSYTADFDRSIEATFSPKPLGIGFEQTRYCHFSPQNTPHRVAAWQVSPGTSRDVEAVLSPGAYQMVAAPLQGSMYFFVDAHPAPGRDTTKLISARRNPEEAHIERVLVEEDRITGLAPRIEPGSIHMRISNSTSKDAMVYIVRADWADGATTAADITAVQEFRDLFGNEVLAPGASFAIRSMVFLFSDLVASTAMYEHLGDTRAFALVRKHFDVLKNIYSRNNGTLVKTIGDAVMAVFRDPLDAVRAAVEMHEEIGVVRDPDTGQELSLCIGLHAGPCIAMEANGVIDYFGTTVNMAARIQSKAAGREVTMSELIRGSQGVREYLDGKGLLSKETQKILKGIAGEKLIARVTVPDRRIVPGSIIHSESTRGGE